MAEVIKGSGKDMRRWLKQIIEAGGTIRRTRSGHYKITGPAGTAVIPNTFGPSSRARGNCEMALRKYAGLDVKI